jgi:hypothetical protein
MDLFMLPNACAQARAVLRVDCSALFGATSYAGRRQVPIGKPLDLSHFDKTMRIQH